MHLKLNLQQLPKPQLHEAALRQPMEVLKQIASRNRGRIESGGESKQFKNRKEELVKRLRNRAETGDSVDLITDIPGRQRLLLSIYLEHTGQKDSTKWLPPFDRKMALSILGNNGGDWHLGRRRQATLLFFMHFDRLEALSFLGARLKEAYSAPDRDKNSLPQRWHEVSQLIFNLTGPEKVVRQAFRQDNLSLTMERFGIPEEGRFAEKLRQLLLLKAVEQTPYGKECKEFQEIEKLKEERVSDNRLLGSAALEIMVERVETEGHRKWAGKWPDWIKRFGCDPRFGRSTVEGNKWWGWASPSQLRLAQQGITGLTLDYFINFLKKSLSGTDKEDQFRPRSRFLLALLHADKIRDARLVLNRNAYQKLPNQFRDVWTVALLSGTTNQTSMICLSCADDIYIIEGTHSFGLRMFRRDFPIEDFWDNPESIYRDKDFRISKQECPVFIRHDQSGNWLRKFFENLRGEFHTEWRDVYI